MPMQPLMDHASPRRGAQDTRAGHGLRPGAPRSHPTRIRR